MSDTLQPSSRRYLEMTKYPLIYICGPYRAPTRAGIQLNIDVAKRIASLTCLKGWAPITPHMNTAFMDEILPSVGDDFWLDIAIEIMRACRAVVLVPGWDRSSGSLAEIDEANRLGIPVYTSIETLPHGGDVL